MSLLEEVEDSIEAVVVLYLLGDILDGANLSTVNDTVQLVGVCVCVWRSLSVYWDKIMLVALLVAEQAL